MLRVWIVALVVLASTAGFVSAEEGTEALPKVIPEASQGPAPSAEAGAPPSFEQISGAIQQYIQEISEDEDGFSLEDDQHNLRILELQRVQEPATQAGDIYTALAEMKDVESGEPVTVTFELEVFEGAPEVLDAHIGTATPPTGETPESGE